MWEQWIIFVRNASFQAKAWIQALAIYFQAICFSVFFVQIDFFLDSFQAHSCFLTGNPDIRAIWILGVGVAFYYDLKYNR